MGFSDQLHNYQFVMEETLSLGSVVSSLALVNGDLLSLCE